MRDRGKFLGEVDPGEFASLGTEKTAECSEQRQGQGQEQKQKQAG